MKNVEYGMDNFKKIYIEKWNCTDTDDATDIILSKYSRKEQKLKEKQLNISINNLISAVNSMPEDKKGVNEWNKDFQDLIKKEVKILLPISNSEFQRLILDNFMDVADCFYQETKEFDPSLKSTDVMQAMRNVWIMNLIQVIANRPIEYTPAIFAYSMLYPYTDNYLDNKTINKQDKILFNERLENRLKGCSLQPTDVHEEKVFRLVEMIEKQYDREKYPQIYESLLCIHRGQCKSINQQNQLNQNESIINISAEKGGASVLADGYLVCGDMDDLLCEFSFGFGYLLQLIDDLQDVLEDGESNSSTLFVKTSKGVDFDAMTKKLIIFTYTVLDFDMCKTSYKLELEQLILDNCLLLIMEAIANNKVCYTKKFLKKIEKYSPISLNTFTKMKKKIKKKTQRISMGKVCF